jgi:hypothetical protein
MPADGACQLGSLPPHIFSGEYVSTAQAANDASASDRTNERIIIGEHCSVSASSAMSAFHPKQTLAVPQFVLN